MKKHILLITSIEDPDGENVERLLQAQEDEYRQIQRFESTLFIIFYKYTYLYYTCQ